MSEADKHLIERRAESEKKPEENFYAVASFGTYFHLSPLAARVIFIFNFT